jgi:seryl-tRNA synthetase
MQLGNRSSAELASADRASGRNSPDELFTASDGMATLTESGCLIYKKLESIFLDWASVTNASSIRYPALIRVSDLDRLNYFRNFPHLVFCVCAMDESARADHGRRPDDICALDHSELGNAEFCLPPAACYNVYLSLRGKDLAKSQHVTTTGACFRNEDYYDGLRRLRAFNLREIVCVGGADDVKSHLRKYKAMTLEFAKHLGLPVTVDKASDPFFDKDGAPARAARIFPTKEEILYRDTRALASVNYHRRFFGERCEITINGEPAHSGCIGFGIERWIQALSEHFICTADCITAELACAQVKLTSRAGDFLA